MSRFDADPHPLLRPYVRSYWGFKRDFSEMQSFTVTPDCFAELLFFFGRVTIDDEQSRARLSSCALVPLLTRPIRIVSSGVVRCVSVRLYAWGAATIFPELRTMTALWQDFSERLTHHEFVLDALRRDAWVEIAQLLDALVLKELGSRRADEVTVAAISAFLDRSLERPQKQTIEDVASRHNFSARQIERRVRSLSGFSPKQLASLRQFQIVRDELWARPRTDLRSLAAEAGYADQAHMSRQFRRYTGTTPAAFQRDCLRLASFLGSQDVGNLQDERAELD